MLPSYAEYVLALPPAIALALGGGLHMMADHHPSNPQQDLTFSSDMSRYLRPELYDARGKELLRRGWRVLGIAILLIVAWFLVMVRFS